LSTFFSVFSSPFGAAKNFTSSIQPLKPDARLGSSLLM
jgi:hypothetical protein